VALPLARVSRPARHLRMPLGVFFFGKQFHYRGRGPLHEEKARFGPTREAAATCPQGP
jgi:hypothetical protein